MTNGLHHIWSRTDDPYHSGLKRKREREREREREEREERGRKRKREEKNILTISCVDASLLSLKALFFPAIFLAGSPCLISSNLSQERKIILRKNNQRRRELV